MKKIGFMAILALSLSCSADTSSDNNGTAPVGGKGDFSDDVVCDIVNKSGRGLDATQLRDPVMSFGLRAGKCPTDLRELMAKLRSTECDSSPLTAVISETAIPNGTPKGSSYRLVIGKGCKDGLDDGDAHKLMFSVSGATAKVDNPSSNPDDWDVPMTGFEIMAFDESNGVYNFYQHKKDDTYEFFGDSKDFVKGEGGSCGECHTAGAGVMLENGTPLHWARGEDIMPGANELVRSQQDVFSFRAGFGNPLADVRKSNFEFLPHRIEAAKLDGDLKHLLKPLFCPTEFNIDTFESLEEGFVANGERPFRSMDEIPADFWLDPHFSSDPVDTQSLTYLRAISDAGQFVQGVNVPEFFDAATDLFSDHLDTSPRGVFLKRSESDIQYVRALDEIIGNDFITSVLLIDFTQPIFSQKRCALLEFAPTGIDITKVGQANDPDFVVGGEIYDGFLKNLQAAKDNPDAARLAELLGPDLSLSDFNRIREDSIKNFQNACKRRDRAELMADVVRVLSFHRNEARKLPVFSGPSKLPSDRLNEQALLTFDPLTCKLE